MLKLNRIALILSLVLAFCMPLPSYAHSGHGDGEEYYELSYSYSTVPTEHPERGGYVYHTDSLQEACEKGVLIFERVANDVETNGLDLDEVEGAYDRVRERSGRCYYSHVEYTGERVPFELMHRPEGYCETQENGVLTRYKGDCPEPPLGQCPETGGNPVRIMDGVKQENVTDWSSPLDPRFEFARMYTSSRNGDFLPLATNGIGWTSNLFSTTSLTSDIYGGGRIYVDLGDRPSIRFNKPRSFVSPNHPYPATKDVNIWYGKFDGPASEDTVGFPDGRRWLFTDQPDPSTEPAGFGQRLLSEMLWPDGYSIKFTYDLDKRIVSAIQDSRGQRAEFVWRYTYDLFPPSGTAGSSVGGVAVSDGVGFASRSSVASPEQILIDTSYDGQTLTPDVRIDYSYDEVTYYRPGEGQISLLRGIGLKRAQVTDVLTGERLSDMRYSYDPSDPRLLTGISDGRLDSDGELFNYADFSYRREPVDAGINPDIVYADPDNPGGGALAGPRQFERAVNTSHFDDADLTQISFPDYPEVNAEGYEGPYDVTVINSLG